MLICALASGIGGQSYLLRVRILAATLVISIGGAGCATKEGSGAAIGGGAGALLGAALGASANKKNPGQSALIGGLLGGVVGAFAGSAIGRQLDEADRARAEQAALRAIAERDAAVQRELARRNEQIAQQARTELARARSNAEQAEVERRAREARFRAESDAQAAATRIAPVQRWQGQQANGSAQATGPVAVAGQQGCERVNEIAIIGGKEVRQEAVYCLNPSGNGRSRVA